MTSLPLFIMLCSGEHEKIQMAAMMASVGAVSDRKVHVFVSMNAILAFEKSRTTPESRYQGGPISKVMQEFKNIPCQVSMEEKMGCGVGVCLGCVIKTVNGLRRVCKDGPVFDIKEVVRENGVLKVLEGVTSLEEILRVTAPDEKID